MSGPTKSVQFVCERLISCANWGIVLQISAAYQTHTYARERRRPGGQGTTGGQV